MIKSLFARIDSKREELVSFTQELVRIPTINPPGEDYLKCAELLGNRLAKSGFSLLYERAKNTPGDSERYPRHNVIARKEGKTQSGPCVHFNGHLDVVVPGNGWTIDPFEGLVNDGKIYGRGTCDMKGGLATAVIAMEAILEEGIDFPGVIEISGTVDEETGGYGGVAFLAEKGVFSKPRVDHVIIPEPLNVDRVCLGHRGAWWAEVETFGRIAHGSMPFLGDSAIRHMSAFLELLESQLFPALEKKHTRMPVVPEGARKSSLNLQAVHGGEAESYDGLPSPCVADSCRLIMDRRFLIEEDIEEVKAEVTDLLDELADSRSNFRYQIRDIMEFLPTMTDADAPVVKAVSASILNILGKTPEHVISPGTYDQKHIARIGHLHDCIAYGPGILDLAHQPDEYIVIDDMVAAAKVMAASTLKLLGVNI
ncbi:MAG: acetylornithine deacetylase/succinyl-diaminopimelate desuccinylase family protein [SAR324 cluster bacterium]|nr:acetylornithine deacetylase/succinyl-diaminopimelate desuccinylase family protein [SAR324 cluster bacterium]MBL7034238.1 acetylornithine deacetylase/succinyl-diaminopimelate desuccinylase family protein [SAR324 cluster bacterium]